MSDSSRKSFASAAYEAHGRALRAYLLRRVRNHDDARELSQEVWARLLRVDDPARVRDPRAYIYRVAANVLAEFNQLRRRELVQFDSEIFGGAVEQPIDALEDRSADHMDIQRDLRRVLGRLPALLRDIVLLRIRDGLSYQAIGAAKGITAGTARRYFFTGMKQARKSIVSGAP